MTKRTFREAGLWPGEIGIVRYAITLGVLLGGSPITQVHAHQATTTLQFPTVDLPRQVENAACQAEPWKAVPGITNARKDAREIEAYFGRNSTAAFVDARNRLLNDLQLKSLFSIMPVALTDAGDYGTFNAALESRPGLIGPIAAVARRLNGRGIDCASCH